MIFLDTPILLDCYGYLDGELAIGLRIIAEHYTLSALSLRPLS